MKTEENSDLLIINPGNRKQVYQSLGESLAAAEPPVWAALMATFVRNKGFSVNILDAIAEGLDPQKTAEETIAQKPQLVAVVVYGHQPSASTQNMPAAGAVCRAIKELSPETKIITLGGHVAALPERTLHEEAVDFVSVGEGLYTLVDLLTALKTQTKPDLTKVRDVLFYDSGEIKAGPAAPLIVNLDDDMPEMAWDLLPMDKYRAHNWHCFGGLKREPYASIYTTLGCPFHCKFCCIQAPFLSGQKVSGVKDGINSYRYWSPEKVLAQISKLVEKYNVRNIKFADELFVFSKKHVGAICDGIIERGYDLNIWAYARVDSIGEGMLEKLKRAGINWLALGIETGNDRVRDDSRKGYKQESLVKVMDRIREAGINVIGNYIFGLPEDDIETMQETLNLATDLNCEFANFYSAMAYPGSKLYDEAILNGWPLPESWSGYSQHSFDTLPLPTKYLSGSQVLKFRDDAFHKYFENPVYLKMIKIKFGEETVGEIKKMTVHKLSRKFI